MYRHGLALGLRPNEFWDFTFLEFFAYSKGKVDHDRMLWNHTSSLMALMANANRDPKRRPKPFEPVDFNPYSIAEKTNHQTGSPTEEQIEIIKSWRVNRS